MPNINITVTGKTANVEGTPVITCGNSDYKLQLTLDDEWSAATYKTARFVYVKDGKAQHEDVDFTGTTVRVPVLTNIRQVKVGIFAGELYTSTPAVIPCRLSILCGSGEPANPTPEEDARIMELLNLAIKQQASAEKAATQAIEANTAAQDAATKVEAIVAGNEAYTKYESDRRHAPTIIEQANGGVVTVSDSAAMPLEGLHLYGKTTQAEAPTPEATSELMTAGSSGSIAVKLYAKNQLPNNAKSVYKAGVNFIVNEDKSITLKGTATESIFLALTVDLSLCNGDYVLSGCPAGGGSSSYRLLMQLGSAWIGEYGGGKRFTVNGEKIGTIQITVEAGTTVTGLTFYPMISTSGGDYEPYQGVQTAELSTPNGLPGIQVGSGGNYIDENGQQWVCDEIDLERGVHIQRITTAVFSSAIATDGTGLLYRMPAVSGIIKPSDADLQRAIMSNAYKSGTLSECRAMDYGIAVYADYVYIRNKDWASVEDATAALTANPVSCIVPLAEPVETELSEAEVAAYAALCSCYPSTTARNSSGAGMRMHYVADTKTYIDNRFKELAAAILASE